MRREDYLALDIVPAKKIFVELLYEGFHFDRQGVPAARAENLYLFYFGKGDYERFLLSAEKLPEGDVETPIKPMTMDEIYRIVSEMPRVEEIIVQRLNIKGVNIVAETSSIHEAGAIYFKTVQPISEKALDAALRSFEWEQVLEDFYESGSKIDRRVIDFFKGDTIALTTKLSRPEKTAMYFDHAILLTNTKAGKTTVARKISDFCYDRATAARVAGYSGSTAKDVYRSELDGVNAPFYLDEAVKTLGLDALRFILSFMETGKARMGTGAKSVSAEGWGRLKFLGNILNRDMPSLDFKKLLVRMTDNTEALGSRMALIVVASDLKESKKRGMTEWEIANTWFVKAAVESCAGEIEKITFDSRVQEWLSRDCPELAASVESDLAEEGTDPEIRMLFVGLFKSGYAHTRGKALRAAVEDFIPEIHFKKHDIRKIIERAEEYFGKYTEMNLASLSFLLGDSRKLGKSILRILDGSPGYVRAVAAAVVEMAGTGKMERAPMPMSAFAERYNSLPEETRRKFGYMTWGKVTQAVERGGQRCPTFRLLGIEIVKLPEGICLIVGPGPLVSEVL